ncbi:hypothetical protein NDU88_006078 [Pleurodeles waltl]|uniref:Uncharacterized protein n=1 Tax=Pleurodeles waltl TaxID=8319 RepID=A0AAV7MC93_PLEWA|nr:hypothetical protein NDU88_006078 [Pleurodeles waltl]
MGGQDEDLGLVCIELKAAISHPVGDCFHALVEIVAGLVWFVGEGDDELGGAMVLAQSVIHLWKVPAAVFGSSLRTMEGCGVGVLWFFEVEVEVSEQGVVGGCDGLCGDEVCDGVSEWCAGSGRVIDDGSPDGGCRAGMWLEVEVFHQVVGGSTRGPGAGHVRVTDKRRQACLRHASERRH